MAKAKYIKFETSILESSLMDESADVFKVFWTVCSMAEWNGHFTGTLGSIAANARMHPEVVRECLRTLTDVDRASRTKSWGGRRILAIGDDELEYNREWYVVTLLGKRGAIKGMRERRYDRLRKRMQEIEHLKGRKLELATKHIEALDAEKHPGDYEFTVPSETAVRLGEKDGVEYDESGLPVEIR